MSDKDRKKKDGSRKDKDNAAMREAVKERHETAAASQAGSHDDDERLEHHDHDNLMNYKPGTGSDKSTHQGDNSRFSGNQT
jgi:hypothetical protein